MKVRALTRGDLARVPDERDGRAFHRNKRCGDVSLNRKKSAEVIVPEFFPGRTKRQQVLEVREVRRREESRKP